MEEIVTLGNNGNHRPVGVKEHGPRLNRAELARRVLRIVSARGTSAQVLDALGGTRYWLEVIGRLESLQAWEKIAAILQFHQMMRDGRPAQQINVTSFGVSITTSEIEQAKAIVRELTQSNSARPNEPQGSPLMLSGGEGGKTDG